MAKKIETTRSGTPKQAPLATLLASAQRLTSGDIKRVSKRRGSKSSTKSWQEEAWEMYDLVGEQRYLATTLAGRLSQAKLFVGKMDEDGPADDPVPVEEESISEVLSAIGKTAAGLTQLLNRLAINLFVAGDGWLCGIPEYLIKHEDPPETVSLDSLEWKMLSVSEVTISEGDEVTLKLGEGKEDDLKVSPDNIYLIRVWRPHPRRWWESDSPTRASLPVLRELVGLTMHISAQVDSRLAGAGIFIVPQSAQRALQQAAGIDEESGQDQFTEALMEAMLTPINDRSSASALVPLVVTVPDDVVEKFKHITFSTELDSEARSLREEAIRRLALGQDAPPEVLLGTSGQSHWASWLVQAETVQSHIEPPLALICDALTTQYLWPVLKEQNVKDAEEYVVWYDVAHLISRPNRGQDAMALFDKGVISDTAVRRELGFDADDAPDSEDPVKAMILQMIQSNPGMLRSSALADMMKALTAIVEGTPLPSEQEDLPEQVTSDLAPSSTNGATAGVASPGAGQGVAPPRLPEQTGIPQTQGAPAEVPTPSDARQ